MQNLHLSNHRKFVDSAEECPSTSGVTLQLREANAIGTSRSGDGKENGKNRSRRLDSCLYFKPKTVFEIA